MTMALYRALSNLNIGKDKVIHKGVVFPEERMRPQVLQRLVKLGRVSRCNTPPMEVLPGWDERSKKLYELGIVTVEEFFKVENQDLAEILGVKAEKIGFLKEEALDWLKAPQKSR